MANEPKKGANKSGVTHKEYVAVIGGIPPKKTVREIDADVKPRANGRAPGSVRK